MPAFLAAVVWLSGSIDLSVFDADTSTGQLLYNECEDKLRVWIGEWSGWLEKADGVETVIWPSRLHVSQAEADLVAQ